MRILVIEDEPSLADVVASGLSQAGYDVTVANDGLTGLAHARQTMYSVILLDIMLPGMSGWEICETLRQERNTVPILMLTARDAVRDRVHGLELGADDYLPKPFDFTELIARVGALLRRDRIVKSRIIRVSDLEIDMGARTVQRGGREISLTPREYALLEALASHEGQILSRDVIQQRVWMDEESFSNTVDVYVGILRKKLDTGPDDRLIHTVHGVGYVLRSPRNDQKADR
jgi:two-component system copper resistance phosphate regulon response regulator CusR